MKHKTNSENTGSFVVKNIFGLKIKNQQPQWMSKDFQNIIYNCSKDLEIQFSVQLPQLKEYKVPTMMWHVDIQENSKSRPLTLEQYWNIRYMFINEPKFVSKRTCYIFHVKIGDSVYASSLFWLDGQWRSHVGPFERSDKVGNGAVLIFLS